MGSKIGVLTIIFGQLQKSIYYTDITMAFYVVGIVVICLSEQLE